MDKFMERKILFIVNPNSGKRNSGKIIDIIKNKLDQSVVEGPIDIKFEVGLWKNISEFNLLAEKLKKENFTDAVAVGGDGSVNLVASTILNSNIVLGIVPTGSGNGLARSLGYKMKTTEALKQIVKNKTTVIDSGTINNIPFFCTSGLGFDAHIANLFANLKTRGLKTYIRLIAKEFFLYEEKDYQLSIDGKIYNRKAFLIGITNAGQYGNDFYLAPQAKLNDGLFHVVIFKSFNFFQIPAIVLKVMRGKADKSRFIETFVCKELSIIGENSNIIHHDGEPQTLGAEINYKLFPKSLKVIVGDKFDGV